MINHLGHALFDLGRYDDAIDTFQAGMKVDPQSTASLAGLSMLLSWRGRHAEAIPKLQTSIAHRPDNGKLYLYLGYSLIATGRKEEGRKNLKRGVEVDPLFFADWAPFRTLLQRQGVSAEEVRMLWRTSLAANPPKHDAWDGYAELSLFLGREDEYRWARQELLKRFAATSDPLIAERTGRACLFLPGTDEEVRKASALIGKAMAADRSKLGAWVPFYFSFAHGLLAYRQGRFNEASAMMKGGASWILGPAPGLVLAMAQFRLGQKDEARKTLEKALKSFDWQPSQADYRDAWMCHILRREAEGLIRAEAAVGDGAVKAVSQARAAAGQRPAPTAEIRGGTHRPEPWPRSVGAPSRAGTVRRPAKVTSRRENRHNRQAEPRPYMLCHLPLPACAQSVSGTKEKLRRPDL